MPRTIHYKYSVRIIAVLAVLTLLFLGTGTLTSQAAEMEVASQPVIVVGGDRDYPPYEFLDKNGQPAGYNVDLTRAIADVMGMKVEFRFGGWSEMRNALMAGSVGVLQGISYSEDRTKTLSFSPPHTIINHAIFARKDTHPVGTIEELRGKEIVVFQDGIMHDFLLSLGFASNLVMTETPADALRLLASGKHD